MKYIKTKDKVVKVDNKKYKLIKCNEKVVLQINIDEKQIIREYIVNQADTIEELCDEFVVYQPWTNTRYIANKNVFKEIKYNIETNYYKSLGYKNPNIFGAIWTDKGLIYVSKMNEKGELELL